MITIVVYMSKGGVGKTTIAALLGQYLAGRGYTGVIVDLDSQGSQRNLFDLSAPQMLQHVMTGKVSMLDALVPIPDRLVPRFKRCEQGVLALCTGGRESKLALDYAVANPHTLGLDNDLDVLRSALAQLADSADFVIMDLGPSDQVVALAALVASDFILIPTDSERMSLEQIEPVLLDVVAASSYNRSLEVLGIVPTKMEYHFGRLRPSKSQLATWAYLENNFPDLLLRDDTGAVDLPYDEDWKTAVWVNEMLFSNEIGRRARGEALRFCNAVAARLGLEAVSYD